MKIVQEGPLYLIDDRWYSPTSNEFLINRMLDRIRASVSYQFAKPSNSIDDRFMDILKPNHILIDVGATTGEYSVAASARVLAIHAFEANPLKYNCLQKNIKLHNLGNMIAHNYAVTNSPGQVKLYDDDDRIFGGSIYTDGKSDKCFNVQAITLDDFVQQNGISVNVLKLTVNGHEPEILYGASELLKQLDYIIFQSARYEEIIPYLQERGYIVVEEKVSCRHDLLDKITKIVLLKNLHHNK